MLIYMNDKNYGVYLEEDGDDLWITVTNGYCKSYDCIVGCASDGLDVSGLSGIVLYLLPEAVDVYHDGIFVDNGLSPDKVVDHVL